MRTTAIIFSLAAVAAPAAAQHGPDLSHAAAATVRQAAVDAQSREAERERVRQERERVRQDRERVRQDRQRERQRMHQQQDAAGPHQIERITRTLRLGPNGELDVSNIAGDISIARGSAGDVQVEIIKRARGRSEQDARELLQLVQVEVAERNNRAEIRTSYPPKDEMRRTDRRNIHVTVDFNITAPAGTRVRAHSISGAVTAKDIKGEVSLESVSGTIRVAGGGRVASAKSISGDVEILEADTEGSLAASTASGNLVLRRVKARRLDVGSISGSVTLDDVQCSQIEAQTVSGDVSYGGAIAKEARYEFNSHSGNVHVAIAGGTGFELEATSFSGSVRSDIPLQAQGGESGRRHMVRALRGVHGDGSAVLELSTFSGNIVVTKR